MISFQSSCAAYCVVLRTICEFLVTFLSLRCGTVLPCLSKLSWWSCNFQDNQTPNWVVLYVSTIFAGAEREVELCTQSEEKIMSALLHIYEWYGLWYFLHNLLTFIFTTRWRAWYFRKLREDSLQSAHGCWVQERAELTSIVVCCSSLSPGLLNVAFLRKLGGGSYSSERAKHPM